MSEVTHYHNLSEVPTTPESPSGFVYFAICGDAVKIGRADKPQQRISALQIGNDKPVVLKALLPGADREQEVHAKFRHLRIRGEWFRLAPDLQAFMEEWSLPSLVGVEEPHKPPRRGRPRTRNAGPAIAIGEQIRSRREAAGLSQIELAAACSICDSTLGNYETGQRTPSLETAVALAKKLGCEVSDFLS